MKLKYHFSIVPTFCVVTLFPILVGLGFWQLERAQTRKDILNLYQDRFHAPRVTIGSAIESPAELEYRQTEATGSWDPEHEFLLDNRVLNGQAGFHVITPLVFRGNQSAVLVNRGWIPGVADRSQLPQFERPHGETTITGTAIIPPVDVFVLKAAPPLIPNEWQMIWQVLDLERFEQAVPYRIQGVVIRLDPSHPDGFERGWPPPDDHWIKRHEAYAFQWFALAATLLVIYFAIVFRPRKK